MLPEQKAYIYAWVDGVAAAGFRAGVYCSGIAAKEGGRVRYHRGRYPSKCGGKEDRILGRERWLPAVAGMRLPQAPAQSGREWHRVRRGMAVCSISEAAGRRGRVSGQLQPRWKLLSPGNRSRPAPARGFRHGVQRRSVARANPLTLSVAANRRTRSRKILRRLVVAAVCKMP